MFRKCCVLSLCVIGVGWTSTACQSRRYYSMADPNLLRHYRQQPRFSPQQQLENQLQRLIARLRAQPIQARQNNNRPRRGWPNNNAVGFGGGAGNTYAKIQAAKALGRMGAAAAPATEALVEQLGEKDRDLSQACLHALGRIGESAIPRLVEGLKHPNKTVRWRAAAGLAAVWSRGDPSHVRASMARPLFGAHNVDRAVEGLTSALFSVDTQLRASAAFALGVIGPDAAPAVEALAGVATDPEDKVAKQAIIALGRIGEAAQEESHVVAGRMKPPSTELGDHLVELHDPKSAERLRYHVAMSLVGIHAQQPFWIPQTPGLVSDATRSTRAGRAEWHGYSVPALARALRDGDDWRLRHAAAMALGEVGHSYPGGRRALHEAKDDPDPRVRQAVEDALKRETSPRNF